MEELVLPLFLRSSFTQWPFPRVADQLDIKSIAFPAISTGIYGYPKERAAGIAVCEILRYTGRIERLVFACFDSETANIYRGLLKI